MPAGINEINPNAKVSHTDENAGLSRVGKDAIDTGRYFLQFGEDGVTIYDKTTGEAQNKSFSEFLHIWGDPHVNNGEDFGEFHTENFTIDLADGTKVTVQVTDLRPDGTAVVEEIGVMKGKQGKLFRKAMQGGMGGGLPGGGDDLFGGGGGGGGGLPPGFPGGQLPKF